MSDEVVWGCLKRFCGYKTAGFCRSAHSVSGLCTRQACPLANSRYATVVLKEDGRPYLAIKTPERAHTPNRQFRLHRLTPAGYVAEIDALLEHFPPFLIHKCKQRTTKLLLIRRAKGTDKLVRVDRKREKRDAKNERRAEAAAKIEQSIEKELVARLNDGVYDSILNLDEAAFSAALDTLEEQEEERELDKNGDAVMTDDEDDGDFVEDVSDDDAFDFDGAEVDLSESDAGDLEDFDGDHAIGDRDSDAESAHDEDDAEIKRQILKRAGNGKPPAGGKKKRVRVEYEQERETDTQRMAKETW